jgi:hypothetical protein
MHFFIRPSFVTYRGTLVANGTVKLSGSELSLVSDNVDLIFVQFFLPYFCAVNSGLVLGPVFEEKNTDR